MGELTPDFPPSGDCPDCIADMPPLYGRLTLPLADKVFEGLLPILYCDSLWVYMGAYFCVGADNHIDLQCWGGYISPKVLACGCPGFNCWPFCGCIDYWSPDNPVTLEVAGGWPPC